MKLNLSANSPAQPSWLPTLGLMLVALLGGWAGGSHWPIVLPSIGGNVAPATPNAKLFYLLHETADDDAEFSALKVALRKDDFAEMLAAKGIRLDILDKDQFPTVKPPKLPALVTPTGPDKFAVDALPDEKLATVRALIEKYGGPLQ